MAAQLPDKLKTADITRFAVRAAQLEKARPIVTYWCEYHILQQILGKQLHAGDDASSNYAVQLMDKLEATKADNASNDAIVDDVAAKAYIENFALETFNRADESQRANKVTKQTADTFMAAATFMDLLSIWGQVDADIAAKSRFAKYHARRILQAFKAGEDPNATNPVVEEPEQPVDDDGIEAELKALEGKQNGSASEGYRPGTVVDTEANARSLAPDTLSPSGLPPRTSSHQVSPLESSSIKDSRTNSIGGGYFPTTTTTTTNTDTNMPDAHNPASPPQTPGPQDMNPQDFYNTLAPAPSEQPSAPPPEDLGIASPARPSAPTPHQMSAQPPTVPPVQSPLHTPAPLPIASPPIAAPRPPPPTAVAPPQQATTGFRTDDEATALAQKHARWAISALNFEDVNTAVKEFRLALESLGAR
ncbi:Vta1 like-domain-containing protein [Neohortaea acidophila]|uniref:Vta1 like-domain-containing protein n=1 Tax=Neohortaea acidophila TaxID=245834 RepID=A0A6A6PSP6_9PEZI|nr:Vta1 like-domain-containing protein [Neohortaea acidophila]KAF2482513.1 Vta1 like-domain-containing protein [Neohortaea acidophila]